MKKKKLAIIGCGNIANFHVDAFKSINMEINHCASSINSKTINKFAKRHRIKNIWKNPYQLAKSAKKLDGVILCAPTSKNSKILDILIEQKVPTLVEKPVSINLKYLEKFNSTYPKNVMVGFHRRYYYPVNRALNFISSSRSKLNCTLKLPEKIFDVKNRTKMFFNIFENSIHGFDLLNYLFGELELVVSKKNKIINNIFSKIAHFKSKKKHNIQIVLSPNSPDNFYLEIENENERFLLKPFENYYHFCGMKIVNPSKKFPIRKYEPKLIDQGSVFSKIRRKDNHLKPGFLNQARSFERLINGYSDNFGVSANLKDAYLAQKLANKFLN